MFTWYIYAAACDKVILVDRSTEKLSTFEQCVSDVKARLKVHHYPDRSEVKALFFSTDDHLYMQITDINPLANSLTECSSCHRIA